MSLSAFGGIIIFVYRCSAHSPNAPLSSCRIVRPAWRMLWGTIPPRASQKKAVKIPEALHGFNFKLKDQRRKILPLRFHHHQVLRINVLIVVFIKTLSIFNVEVI